MKKFLSIILSLTLAFSLAVPAFAAPTAEPDYEGSYQQFIDQEILAKGGVPGQVNVLYQGAMLDFPDAIPVIVNSRTMIPVRAVIEGMEGDVAWNNDTRTVSIALNGAEVSFPIGSDTFTITKDGKTTTDRMDTAAYIDGNDRTMVPLRFLSQAVGYTVLWDNDYRTAVVMDMEAKIAEIDAQFTYLNKILAQQLEGQQGKKFVQTLDMQGLLAVPDLNGTMLEYPLSAALTAYTDGINTKLDGSVNLADLFKAIQTNNPELLEELQVSLGDLSTLLSTDWSKVSASILMNDQGLYVNIPLLNTLGELGPENAWMDLGLATGMDMSAMTQMTASLTENMTMGTVLTAALTESAQAYDAFHAEEALDLSVAMVEAMFGDDQAKVSGSSYTWTFDQQLSDLEPGAAGGFQGQMTFSLNGSYDMDFTMDLGENGAMTIQGKGTETKGTLSMSLNLPDVAVLSFTMDQTLKTTTSLPSFTLPAGTPMIEF